jgi:putative membrane protein
MKSLTHLPVIAILTVASPALAQQDFGPWRMHDWGWGWGGMWLGPIFMLLVLGGLVAGIVALVRLFTGSGPSGDRTSRSAREILDERYARGEIDREEYLRRRDDMAGQP